MVSSLMGCSLLPPLERDFVWEKLGTEGKVVDKTQLKILAPDSTGKPVVGKVDASGMYLIDAPTLEYFRKLDADKKSGK